MAKDVEKFCAACMSCASSKKLTQKPYGLLKPLLVPKYPWAQIGVDFLGPLTESATLLGKFNMVCVVINHLTCMAHLIPTRLDYTARNMAKVFHANIFRLHGVPKIIISNRDKLFTLIFWKTLYELLGTKLRLLLVFHPQTDGQTKRLIRTILALIRVCINPVLRDWATKLPSIEFAVNSARLETTGFSPFALNYGQTPHPILVPTNTDMYRVRNAARNIKYALMIAHNAIIGLQISQMVKANRHRRPSPFKTNNLVYVSTKNMRVPLGKPHKLLAQWIGPVRIDGVVKEGATYHVELPNNLKQRGMKPIFHALLLKPHVPYEDCCFPGRNYKQIASLEANDDEWVVERIGGHCSKGNNAMFEIVWQLGDCTWESYHMVRHLEALRQYFEALGISRTKELLWKEDREVLYDELSNSGSETLKCASVGVLKEAIWEPQPVISTIPHCLRLDPLLSHLTLSTKCTTAGKDAAVATKNGGGMHHQRTTQGPTNKLMQVYYGCSTRWPRPASKPLGQETPHPPIGEGKDSLGGQTWPGPCMLGEVRWSCTKVLLASVPMGHCVHNQESRLTKGHLQEDALNSNALNLMLGIAANHLPEARQPPGPAMDPPYKEEVPQPSMDKERKQEENKRVPNPVPTTLLDPVKRGPANHPRRPATEPTQAGTVGLQVNKLARKVLQAILLVKNVISVTTTLSKHVKRTHQRVIDREWDIMEDMSRIAL
ncbi:Transposon Ty3-I Gag-Pol polyprotein [Rhizoctonia solani]|uniref:Transposon Ty3-I Gag-Pol polyprotein n=1 Tax=Rhizoctonia solani TaxID=456999 RepID=A0A8H8SZ51_9AGAM|nr:Transposon Ty3-I Gag-Pol polyprotein [Rhizoctonia solani]QRW23064.1 Transposon Ty3-I Gag-Pol polyprotein [Rhizoctonia solani]